MSSIVYVKVEGREPENGQPVYAGSFRKAEEIARSVSDALSHAGHKVIRRHYRTGRVESEQGTGPEVEVTVAHPLK